MPMFTGVKDLRFVVGAEFWMLICIVAVNSTSSFEL